MNQTGNYEPYGVHSNINVSVGNSSHWPSIKPKEFQAFWGPTKGIDYNLCFLLFEETYAEEETPLDLISFTSICMGMRTSDVKKTEEKGLYCFSRAYLTFNSLQVPKRHMFMCSKTNLMKAVRTL